LRRKRATLREVGRVVRVAHDAGLYHGDLQLRNVLVRHDEKPAVFLVDLDKAGWRQPLRRRSRAMNLLRLSRSAAKAARSDLCITKTDMVRFLKGYTGVEGAGAVRPYWRMPLLKTLYRMKWVLSDALYNARGGSAQKSKG
jgi:tRNA A-37 threonylcarbamoyl transferase component Bud32